MTTFALIHGAWGSGWHWASVPERLRALGHDVVAPDMPCEDANASFDDYARVVLDALADVDGDDVVVAGFSMGGQTAPLVAERRPVRGLVYVAALLPLPGVTLNDQFAGTELVRPEYRTGIEPTADPPGSRWVDFDVYRRISYDDTVPEAVVRERFARLRTQAVGAYALPSSLAAHPDVPTRYLLGTEDRLMNNAYWDGAVQERLGIEPTRIASSHGPMVTHPEELVELLTSV